MFIVLFGLFIDVHYIFKWLTWLSGLSKLVMGLVTVFQIPPGRFWSYVNNLCDHCGLIWWLEKSQNLQEKIYLATIPWFITIWHFNCFLLLIVFSMCVLWWWGTLWWREHMTDPHVLVFSFCFSVTNKTFHYWGTKWWRTFSSVNP